MPPRSPTTTATAEEDDVFAAVWGNPQAGNSQLSFSSAVRRNDATPSKRRRGSEGLAKRGRTDHDPWSSADPPSPSASHSRSRTIDDEAGTGSYWMSGRSTSQHPLRHSSSHASSSSWTLDHGTRPGMRRALSGNDTDKEAPEAGQGEGSVALDREMLVIIHEVSCALLNWAAPDETLVLFTNVGETGFESSLSPPCPFCDHRGRAHLLT